MTGLSTALTTLVDSLRVNQERISYSSENIANVNTEGYTRKVVSQETRVANGVAIGVSISDIERSIDNALLVRSQNQSSLVAQAETTNAYYDRIQRFGLGSPDSSSTINNSLNDFFARLEDFSNDPGSAIKRSLAIDSANSLATSFSELANGIQSERLTADTEISTTIDSLNASLETLHDLNIAIRENSLSAGNVERLLDARDAELEKVKEIVDANVVTNSFGQVSLSLGSNEILGEGQLYRVQYSKVTSLQELINDTGTNSITSQPVNAQGQLFGNIETIVSASDDSNQIDNINGGKLRALMDLRDTELPKTLDQLDNIAFTVANEFNKIHNNGSGFPPPSSFTGDELVTLNNEHFFSGNFRLTVTDANGNPVENRYGGDLLPLEIDFDEFDGGGGKGTASIQSLINEINNYYGLQDSQIVNLGPASDIKLASISDSVVSTKSSGTITFTGIPNDGDSIIINGETITFVAASPGANEVLIAGSLASTLENLSSALNSSANANISQASYASSSTILTVTAENSGVAGDAITLDATGAAVATASAATLAGGANATGEMEFDFELLNLDSLGENITFDVTAITADVGTVNFTSFTNQTIAAGDRRRTDLNGITSDSFSVTLDNTLGEGDSFDITASVIVTDSQGNTYNEDITYAVTIPDPTSDIKNLRYQVSSVTGNEDGEIVNASSNNSFLTASLVDENGNPITTNNTEGNFRISTASSNLRITIDELDSSENGATNAPNISQSATSRGLSHFLGLNNLFTFGGDRKNSALNIGVREDIISSPQLLTSGKATLSTQTGADAVYTFEIGAGSNSTALDLVKLQDANISFTSAGTLPELFTTINSYATEIYNFSAQQANSASAELTKQNLLKDAIDRRIDEISGVNIDEELAETFNIQNSYTASARVLSIVRELIQTLNDTLLS